MKVDEGIQTATVFISGSTSRCHNNAEDINREYQKTGKLPVAELIHLSGLLDLTKRRIEKLIDEQVNSGNLC